MLLQLEISSSDVLRIETEDTIEHYPGIVTLNKVFLLMAKLFQPLSDIFASIFGEFFNLVAPPFSSRLAASSPAYTEPSLLNDVHKWKRKGEFGCANSRRARPNPREPEFLLRAPATRASTHVSLLVVTGTPSVEL